MSRSKTPQCCYQHNAIVLDNELYSTPYINFQDSQLADGIAGGGVISNLGGFKEASALAKHIAAAKENTESAVIRQIAAHSPE